ncbi:hypothetical protein BFW38_10675 [Terasakiispira papahanaumokuakeensis]|uniref:Uncharacterized protein n=1 Tax=Terasakiispira papahanaumokuakeensis TaxID=197479 RepID=A0A1E2VAH9_9GAMM|nr:hypothetical protein [Terasakiispira papahanaumokuakeensis]ODC03933.1 hypothetical protein BFW38_10675 [Terasakiispira papahanaumokuakeensis]
MYDTTASPLVMALPGLITTGLLALLALGLLRRHPYRLSWALALAPTLGLLATQQNPLSWPLAPLVLSAVLATLITRMAQYRISAALGIIAALAISGFQLFMQLPFAELLPLALLPLLALAGSPQPHHSSRLFAQSLGGAFIALAIALSASTETGLWIGLITLTTGLTWLATCVINIDTQHSEAPLRLAHLLTLGYAQLYIGLPLESFITAALALGLRLPVQNAWLNPFISLIFGGLTLWQLWPSQSLF